MNPANDQSFWYSPSNRLQDASGPWGELTFYYDNVGNRTYRVLDDGTTMTQTYIYAVDGNRLLSITEGGTTIRSFIYTANGDIETDDRSGTVYSYGWNDANRLETVSVGGTLKGSYLYNGFDQLASRQLTNMSPAGTTHLIYDRAGNLIAEADGATGAILREYVWLEETPHLDDTTGSPSFMPLAVVADVDTASPKLWFVHPDHLNRPLAMTDENKTVISDSWLPFGKVSGTAMTDARFPGQWNQLESGLAYNWHRHYDPTTGRYTQADPIGLAAGPSLYGYANGNPVNYIDPQGLKEYPDNFVGPLPPEGYYRSEMTRTECGRIPPYPPGSDIQSNMLFADNIWNPFWFYNRVRNNGRWDYKQRGRRYEDFGNFNFGAAGTAFGFPLGILQRGAGWANQKADPSRKRLGNPWGGHPYGDDPDDQKQIERGASFCKCMGY